MMCNRCGAYTETGDIICPSCGALLQKSGNGGETGAQAIRQGKRAREAVKNRNVPVEKEVKRRRRAGASHATVELPVITEEEVRAAEGVYSVDEMNEAQENGEDEVYARRYRSVYTEEFMTAEQAQAYLQSHANDGRKVKARMVNWVKVTLAAAACLVILVIGGYVYLKRTEGGQKIMARLGREASSTALWAVGEEKLDSGDILGAIEEFEKAKAQDEEAEVVDVDGLLLLGTAYEANGDTRKAADLYEEIYTGTPSRTEAYVNHIRILLASDDPGDQARAGELMKLAYDKTGEKMFNTQRNDLLPAAPEVDLTAGFYEQKKYIAVTSYQGYDVYYTFDENAELPSGGTKFTERIFLDEGIHTLRAVAVNGELVSDELRGTYKIIMPSPQTPRANLAPNTYKNRQNVRLKPGLDNVDDNDIIIYYTIDGSPPDADSPTYTGEPFWLPGGRVTLKAVAVNKYGKVSNTLEILYKIEAKPYPLTAYTSADAVNGIKLYSTTMQEFQKQYGEGKGTEEVTLPDLNTECKKVLYDWGYAVFSHVKSGWVIAELYFTSQFKAPRGTNVGDSEAFVVGKFRDMGQVTSPSGNRGLYATNEGTGKIWVQEDGTKIIRYRCFVESHTWQLDYILNKSGIVTAIDMIYQP